MPSVDPGGPWALPFCVKAAQVKQAFPEGLGEAWSGLDPNQKALLGVGGGMAGGALIHHLMGGGTGTDLALGAGGLGAAGIALWPQIQQLLSQMTMPSRTRSPGEQSLNLGMPHEQSQEMPGSSVSAQSGQSPLTVAMGPSAPNQSTSGRNIELADAVKHPVLGKYFKNGQPDAQTLMGTTDEQLRQHIGLLSSNARAQLGQQLAGFRPSFGQSLGAKAMGIDIEGQKKRFADLLGKVAAWYGRDKQADDETFADKLSKGQTASMVSAGLTVAPMAGYAASFGRKGIEGAGAKLPLESADAMTHHVGLDPNQVLVGSHSNLPSHASGRFMGSLNPMQASADAAKTPYTVNVRPEGTTALDAAGLGSLKKMFNPEFSFGNFGHPNPEISKGILAHELGHAKSFDYLHRLGGHNLNRANAAAMAAGKLSGMAGGLVTPFLDPDKGGYQTAMITSLMTAPLLANELAASHLGGRGMMRMHPNTSAFKNYLSPYRGVPTYMMGTAAPWIGYGVRRYMKDHE